MSNTHAVITFISVLLFSYSLQVSANNSQRLNQCKVGLEELQHQLVSSNQELVKEKVPSIIAAFRSGERSCIAQVIEYPFKTRYPVEPIRTAEEMEARFDEVFDADLVRDIANSTLDEWPSMGWRGVMFKNGVVWTDASSFIHRVNIETDRHKNVLADVLDEQRRHMHPSLREFKSAVLTWNSKRFNVRIDDIGESGYRYAVWAGHKAQSMKPDLIIQGGIKSWVGGTLSYPEYTFKNGRYTYIVAEGWSPEWPEGKIGFLQVTKAMKDKSDKHVAHVDFYEKDTGMQIPQLHLRVDLTKEIITRLIAKQPLTELTADTIDVGYIFNGNEGDIGTDYYEKAIDTSFTGIELSNLAATFNQAANSNALWFIGDWDLTKVVLLSSMQPFDKSRPRIPAKPEDDRIYITVSDSDLSYFLFEFAQLNGVDKLQKITLFSTYIP